MRHSGIAAHDPNVVLTMPAFNQTIEDLRWDRT
jgi:hypothetical protein